MGAGSSKGRRKDHYWVLVLLDGAKEWSVAFSGSSLALAERIRERNDKAGRLSVLVTKVRGESSS